MWHTHLKKRLNSYINHNASDEAATKGSLNREETSQESSPNASRSFGGSNIVSKEDDDVQIGETFECFQDYSELAGMLQEVDKPELLEIPFDIDPDVWNFIDGFQQPENSLTPRAHQESEEAEVDKWFKNLESELGLEEDNSQQQEQPNEAKEESPSPSLLESYELLINH